jgi:hypothetical protein
VLRLLRLWLLLALAAAAALPAAAQLRSTKPTWAALTPAQQQALAPLQGSWEQMDAPRRQKWLEVAERFPRMPMDERQRVRERMASWAALSPTERAQARLQFQESRQLSAEEKQAKWQEYKALSEDERKRLALDAKQRNGVRPVAPASAAKQNIVAVAPSPAPRSVAPTMVQNKPGVSTNTIATKTAPPAHHQPGLPKIVATPAFVDPKTLLPRRGPQGAAMRTAASTDPTRQP